jgi:hypothetical protein
MSPVLPIPTKLDTLMRMEACPNLHQYLTHDLYDSHLID